MNVEKVTMKYDGEFFEMPISELDMSPENPSDSSVLNAVKGYLHIRSLDGFVVYPPENERTEGLHDSKTVLNIHPTASYGF